MKKNRLSSFLLALSLTLGLLAPMGATQAAESRSAILDGMEVEATLLFKPPVSFVFSAPT